jgi:hypothetical protein
MGHDAETVGGSDRSPSTPPRRPVTLQSRRVRYEGRPDRVTVFPPGLSDDARMTTWLSADSGAVVDLETVR